MKVLHVIPSLAPRYGGPPEALLGMCRALDREGIKSLIVTTDADGTGRLPVTLERPTNYRNIEVIFFCREWSETLKYSHSLADWLKKNVMRFDLVNIHAVFSHSSLAAGEFCRRHGVPYVVCPLGTLDPWCLSRKRFRKLLLWNLAARNLMQGAAAIHYTSEEEKERTEKALGLKRGIVIPLGVDEEPIHTPSGASTSPYVLILSRLHPKKNIEFFIKIFLKATEKSDLKEWRLIIAGDGEPRYVSRLKSIVDKKQRSASVCFVGWLEAEAKAPALRNASLLASTSYHENFGLSVVEALAYRVPVFISKNINLAKEIEEARAGWVVDLDWAIALERIVSVLQNGEERRVRGARGAALVQSRFLWSTISQKLTQLFQKIIEQRHSEDSIHELYSKVLS